MTLKWNWGAGIALTYAVFAGCTTGFVVFAMRQPVDLVSRDYYADALQQDLRARATERADDLGPAVSVAFDAQRGVEVRLPARMAGEARGQVTLYRASDARADRTFVLALDPEGRQRLPVAGLAAGSWRVKVDWTIGDQPFHYEAAMWVP